MEYTLEDSETREHQRTTEVACVQGVQTIDPQMIGLTTESLASVTILIVSHSSRHAKHASNDYHDSKNPKTDLSTPSEKVSADGTIVNSESQRQDQHEELFMNLLCLLMQSQQLEHVFRKKV